MSSGHTLFQLLVPRSHKHNVNTNQQSFVGGGMYFVIPFVVVAVPCTGGVLTFHSANTASRRRLERQLGMEIPSSNSALFMAGATGAVFFGVTRMIMGQLPHFKEGGVWGGQGGKIKTWADLWKSTGPKTMGTMGCLLASFAVAGSVKPHYDAGALKAES